MSNEVPTKNREIVRQRDQMRCLRCGGPAAELAHRRTRAVPDEHQHCPCNLWFACNSCHQGWQHKNPTLALEAGWAVSRHEGFPGSIPVVSWYGKIRLLCDGDIEFVVAQQHPLTGGAS